MSVWSWLGPNSAERGRRAEQAGRLGEAVRHYVAANAEPDVKRCLSRLPHRWSVQPALSDVVHQLFKLQTVLELAKQDGVPEARETGADSPSEALATAFIIVCVSVDRCAQVARYKHETADLRRMLDEEAQGLRRLRGAIVAAQHGLVEQAYLTTRSPAASVAKRREVRQRFSRIATASRELQRQQRERPI